MEFHGRRRVAARAVLSALAPGEALRAAAVALLAEARGRGPGVVGLEAAASGQAAARSWAAERAAVVALAVAVGAGPVAAAPVVAQAAVDWAGVAAPAGARLRAVEPGVGRVELAQPAVQGAPGLPRSAVARAIGGLAAAVPSPRLQSILPPRWPLQFSRAYAFLSSAVAAAGRALQNPAQTSLSPPTTAIHLGLGASPNVGGRSTIPPTGSRQIRPCDRRGGARPE